MKVVLRTLLVVLVLLAALNFRWVHAFSVAAVAEPCKAELVATAQVEVVAFFGSVSSNPIIRCIHKPTLGLNVSYGNANFAPGLPTILLIGPQGENIDVVAHEWAHAELLERVGFLNREFTLPTWFDEGLAMQVDHRAAYSSVALREYQKRSEIVPPDLTALSSPANFFTAGDQGKYHYAYAKCVVTKWITGHEDWLAELEDSPQQAMDSMMSLHCDSCALTACRASIQN